MEQIVRQKVRGRKVAKWPSFLNMSKKSRMGRKKEMTDSERTIPGQSTTIAKIHPKHRSDKAQQDFIEEIKKRKIRETYNLKEREELEWDLECWLQNGRPIYGQPGKQIIDAHGHKESTSKHDSKSVSTAYEDLMREKKRRGIL